MGTYVYAIIDSTGTINDCVRGLDGAPVYNIPFRDIGAAATKLDDKVRQMTKEHVLQHEEVVETLMEESTVLPVRFPAVFNKEESVVLMMEQYYPDFRANLDRLRNKVEFGVKVIWPGQEVLSRVASALANRNGGVDMPDGSPEGNFVRERFEKYRIRKEFEEEADRCVSIVDGFFGSIAEARKLKRLRSENLLLDACYLLDKDKQEDFRRAFDRARNTCGDLKYLLSGPWPPYSFVALNRNASTPVDAL